MAELKTTYKDDLLNESINNRRRYKMINNSDGTVSFEDVTSYEQVGDVFGAADVNAMNLEINNSLHVVKLGGSSSIKQEAYKTIKENWSIIPEGNCYLEMGYGTSFGFGYKFSSDEGYFIGFSQDIRSPYKVTFSSGVWRYITFTMGTEYEF